MAEHGSDLHWPGSLSGDSQPPLDRAEYFSSGRDALRAMLLHGQRELGWKRLWLPSYLCQEVVASAVSTGLSCSVYPDSPLDQPPALDLKQANPGDALLLVNYFGLRSHVDSSGLRTRGIAVIEDHTHDPWSHWARSSTADFCMASYRKTLPVPEGSALWSPAGHTLPRAPAVSPERELASYKKFAGMVLKGLYLDGAAVDKTTFRALLGDGEQHIASGEISGISQLSRQLLRNFPVEDFRRARRNNFSAFCQATTDLAWLRVLAPQSEDCVPFACVLVLDTADRREQLRAGLIARDIYPAVLWPLEHAVLPGVPDAHVKLSQQILSLHCDHRYTADDMRRVARVVREVSGS